LGRETLRVMLLTGTVEGLPALLPLASYSPECVEGLFSEVRIAPVCYGPLLETGASPKTQASANAWLWSEAPSLTLTRLT
jgi:hypothetical protein